jgi:hypothetical protein
MMIIRDSLTGLDGKTYALAKIVGVAVVLVFLGLAIASFITGKPFAMIDFGVGAGAVVAAMGVAVKMGETSEPKPGDPK